MAVRTAKELLEIMKAKFPEGYPEGFEDIVEDITDSVGTVDSNKYIDREMYDSAVSERDKALEGLANMRDKYINRFYGNYTQENSKGYIMGDAPQEEIEREEKIIMYDDLFE